MKSKIVQEFKGYINNVPFDNHNLYYSVEYILNEIESTFDLEVPFTLVRDMKYALQSAFDDISETTQGEIETEIVDCMHNASSINDFKEIVRRCAKEGLPADEVLDVVRGMTEIGLYELAKEQLKSLINDDEIIERMLDR